MTTLGIPTVPTNLKEEIGKVSIAALGIAGSLDLK
jgi:hypothetical protein